MAKLQPYHKIDRLVGNQYAIQVRKNNYKPSFYSDCRDYALAKLSPNGFKLWFWIREHQEKEEIALSRKQVCDKLNFSSRTYTTLIRELKEKEFLVPAQLHPGIKGWLFIDEGPLRNLRGVSYKGELEPKNFTIV